MPFNSIDFAIFLPITFALYWFVFKGSRKAQNLLLLAASYVYYGWWDWRFLLLIITSTLVDFFVGKGLEDETREKRRKLLLAVSLTVNLGILVYFKYANFFLDNLVGVFSIFGVEISDPSLNIILPVGISFYTFKTLSYSIDVYRRKMQPTRDFLVYAAYLSFFPQLLAGPIDRAKSLLPQFTQDRSFDYRKAVDGLRQILWGLFKKVVIADSCAVTVNEIFNGAGKYSGSTLLLGGVFFAIQIYGDFSGYSDIAIGVGRLFGFEQMKNFAFPYFSRDIAEFWRRWHISLTSWFRDYLYIPLGGSRGSRWQTIRNVLIIFLVSGFWHGAQWTFIFWGALNALYFLPLLVLDRNRDHLGNTAQGRLLPTFQEATSMVVTFGLSAFAWLFFRADSMSQVQIILGRIFSSSLFQIPAYVGRKESFYTLLWVAFFMIVEWLGRENDYALEKFGLSWHPALRWVFYYVLIYLVFIFSGSEQQFIYLRF